MPKPCRSMSEKQTKHATKTRMSICNGFVELMQQKCFDDITILDVCEKALITRATFYKYYEDKYHLALCVLDEKCEQLFEKAGYGDDTKTTKEVYHNVISLFLDYLDENLQKFQNFFKVGCNEKIRALFMRKVTILIEDVLKKEESTQKLNVPIDIESNFLVGGLTQILMYALENRKTYTKQEVLSWVEIVYEQFYTETK